MLFGSCGALVRGTAEGGCPHAVKVSPAQADTDWVHVGT